MTYVEKINHFVPRMLLFVVMVMMSLSNVWAEVSCLPHLRKFLDAEVEVRQKVGNTLDQVEKLKPYSVALRGDGPSLSTDEKDQLVWLIQNAGYHPYLMKKNLIEQGRYSVGIPIDIDGEDYRIVVQYLVVTQKDEKTGRKMVMEKAYVHTPTGSQLTLASNMDAVVESGGTALRFLSQAIQGEKKTIDVAKMVITWEEGVLDYLRKAIDEVKGFLRLSYIEELAYVEKELKRIKESDFGTEVERHVELINFLSAMSFNERKRGEGLFGQNIQQDFYLSFGDKVTRELEDFMRSFHFAPDRNFNMKREIEDLQKVSSYSAYKSKRRKLRLRNFLAWLKNRTYRQFGNAIGSVLVGGFTAWLTVRYLMFDGEESVVEEGEGVENIAFFENEQDKSGSTLETFLVTLKENGILFFPSRKNYVESRMFGLEVLMDDPPRIGPESSAFLQQPDVLEYISKHEKVAISQKVKLAGELHYAGEEVPLHIIDWKVLGEHKGKEVELLKKSIRLEFDDKKRQGNIYKKINELVSWGEE